VTDSDTLRIDDRLIRDGPAVARAVHLHEIARHEFRSLRVAKRST
jgi:hypothetical protein